MKARIPGGGAPANMNHMIRQAQKMQEDMQALQAELDERVYDISAGGGMVKLSINGKKEVIGLEISPEIVDPDDTETLADIITAAVNQAIKQVDDTNSEEMQKITGSMGLPGLF